jgi:hypothetical protein
MSAKPQKGIKNSSKMIRMRIEANRIQIAASREKSATGEDGGFKAPYITITYY